MYTYTLSIEILTHMVSISHSTFHAYRKRQNSCNPLGSSPSTEPELCDDNGEDGTDIAGEVAGIESLKINNACLKPGLKSQS
ncbi:hypothetical protein HanRHA438_Chr09g0423221 [Helianthus annuus]|nr:hypothetical protein HanRHA438_Chr09g0423221 [Helianthus annuus]